MNLDLSLIELIDIDNISYGSYENMVDISVEDDETFVLSNGIISHNSAISGMSDVRNPEIHGGFPLRGKVLNVHPSHNRSIADVMKNETLAALMASLGLNPTQRANRHALRYGKCYFAHDMDEDGKNIGALLTNFFFTYWPELFDPNQQPYFYVFMTPFIIASKGKQRKYWYGEDYKNFDADDYKGWSIARAKGLARLEKLDWAHALNNPQLMPIQDEFDPIKLENAGLDPKKKHHYKPELGKLCDTLSLIFDKNLADERKDWI